MVDGPDAKGALRVCQETGSQLTTLFNTHVHWDHIGINHDLHVQGLLTGMRVIGAAQTSDVIPGITEQVRDGDSIQLLGQDAVVMLTEGHLNGHLSLLVDGLLFCGDTLFAGGCGYLFDGPPIKMFESLGTLGQLPPETLICCAHEYTQDNLRFAYSVDANNEALKARIKNVWVRRSAGESVVPSLIADEIATNPFLRCNEPAVRAVVAKSMPEQPLSDTASVFAAMRELKNHRAYKALTDDDLLR